MSNKDLEAFLDDVKHEHYTHEEDQNDFDRTDNCISVSMSMYRTEIAMAALTGIIQKASGFDPVRHAYLAIDYADALIKALETSVEE